MERRKRQKFKEGSIIKIELSESRLVLGRLLPGYHLCIYDGVFTGVANFPSNEAIISYDIFLYVRVFKDVITKGLFEIIGFYDLVQQDIDKIPPHFEQDMTDIENCVIYYEDGREIEAMPEECIGLEGPVIWEAASLIDRINDRFAGKKNAYEELFKVILSKNDPRYLNPGVRWDFNKEKFCRE
ncbi:MAG TPA: hypothetical protein VGN00_26075 [Puia sp.]